MNLIGEGMIVDLENIDKLEGRQPHFLIMVQFDAANFWNNGLLTPLDSNRNPAV